MKFSLVRHLGFPPRSRISWTVSSELIFFYSGKSYARLSFHWHLWYSDLLLCQAIVKRFLVRFLVYSSRKPNAKLANHPKWGSLNLLFDWAKLKRFLPSLRFLLFVVCHDWNLLHILSNALINFSKRFKVFLQRNLRVRRQKNNSSHSMLWFGFVFMSLCFSRSRWYSSTCELLVWSVRLLPRQLVVTSFEPS